MATDPIAAFVDAERRAGSWPGAAWVVEEEGRTVAAGAAGLRAVLPVEAPASLGTIYDLASLTKPLATAALLARLEEQGLLSLDAPADAWLPGLACARGGRPTLWDLALHRSGLPAWRPFYLFAGNRAEVLNRVVAAAAEAPCGTRVVYSDCGYILLGAVLEGVSGRPLDALFRDEIARPLGLTSLGYLPPPALKERIAPTEIGNEYEARLAAAAEPEGSPGPVDREETGGREPMGALPQSRAAGARAGDGRAGRTAESDAPSRPVRGPGEAAAAGGPARRARDAAGPGPESGFRTALIHGEVHDGNAHALGGVAGHAGLFGTAADVAALAREFLGRGTGLFSAASLERFRENRTPGLGEGRTLGWKRALSGAPEAAGVLPEEAFGHTGFTGTSLWCDPVRVRSYVLLTNRVHPRVAPIDMNRLRRRFHEIARDLP